LSEATEKDGLITTALLLQVLLVSVVAGVLLLFAPTVDGYIGAPVTDIVVVMLVVNIGYQFVASSLNGQKKVHLSSLLSPVWWGGRAIFQIGLAVAGFGLVGLLWGYVLSGVVAIGVGLSFLSIRLARPTKEALHRIISFAKYSWVTPIKGRSFLSMDTIILGFFVTNQLIGVYEVAWNIASLFAVFGASISATLFPEISSLASENRFDEVREAVSAALSYAGLFLIPGLVGGALVGETILGIYGAEFPMGYEILIILVFAQLIYAFEKQLTNTLDAIDRPEQTYKINLLFITLNLGLNVVLVSQYGWYGAAVATTVTAVVSTGISYRVLRRYVAFQVPVAELSRQVFAAAIMGGVVFAGKVLVGSSLPVVLVLVAVGAGTYFSVLWAISEQFRKTVRDNVPVV